MALSAQYMSLPISRLRNRPRFQGWLVCMALAGACEIGCQNAPSSSRSTGPVSIGAQNDLVRGDRLLKVLSLTHKEVATRLGPHRIESQTRWTITPIPSQRAAQVPPVQPGFKLGSPAQPFSVCAKSGVKRPPDRPDRRRRSLSAPKTIWSVEIGCSKSCR